MTAYRGDRSWRAAVDDVRRVQVELLIELGRPRREDAGVSPGKRGSLARATGAPAAADLVP